MVTVTSVSVEPDRPTLKPTRSMTHPLRDPKAGKRRPKQGEPFDPADLSRRLEAHLAEQKALSERRRAERKAKEAAAQKLEGYHHVPKMAATSFARTATPDALRQVHRLSEHVLKHQLEASPLNDPITGLPLMGIQRVQAMDQVILKSEVLKARNQFQWTRDMEEAAEADVDRDINKPVRRTFSGEFSHLLGQKVHKTCRPLSTGDIFSETDEDILVTGKPRTKLVHDANDHRNDWAQRDENQAQSRRTVKDRVSPFLKKRDSVWILKGKKEKTKTERDEVVPTLGFFGSPPDVSRASKGFLARFKRHPS